MSEKKTSSNKNVKKRNWAFVVYPSKVQLDALKCEYDGSDGYGTLPDDWIEQLQKTGLQGVISPLHDKDLNPDGLTKKPHYHVIVTYSGPTSFNVVKALTESFNAPIPQALEQVRGYYRYLTHKDNPEKYQYDEKEIRSINGFNIADFVELSKSEIGEIKRRITKIIREEKITEYARLINHLLDNDMFQEHDIASSNTIHFNAYIKSQKYMFKEDMKSRTLVDKETGEIIE